MALLDRVHDMGRLVTLIGNRASHLEAEVAKLKSEGDPEQLAVARQQVDELQADNAKLKSRLDELTRLVSNLEVDNDPFTEKPDDSSVPMETRQEFDDSILLEE
ncbi:hypothetical protein BHE74_00051408 [Ensete ventricosum]|nr:hypothetical protein BHE74_00051408 [Ensete ventricosum]